jgi:hypothetical protein
VVPWFNSTPHQIQNCRKCGIGKRANEKDCGILQKIGPWAFDRCTSLRHIIIPSSVTSIGDRAFFNCVSLATVLLNNGLQRIGESAFNNCTSICTHEIALQPCSWLVMKIEVGQFCGKRRKSQSSEKCRQDFGMSPVWGIWRTCL